MRTGLKTWLGGAVVLCSAFGFSPAKADAFPTRPVSFVVPYAPGGTTDVLARIVAKAMTAQLGQSVIVENVAGGGGTLGTGRVARADPDGYTLTFGNMGSMAANVSLYPNLKFDPRTDFVPIGLVSTVPMVMSVSNKSGITDMKGFLARLREKPGVVNFGNGGVGTTANLAAAAFMKYTDTKGVMVNYRGSGPALNDLVAGVVDVLIDQTVIMIPMHSGKTVKAIAVSGKSRLPQLPDVPTFAEGGVPEFELSVWNAVAAPKGTPPEVVKRLEEALAAALDDPDVKARFADLAAPVPMKEERGGAYLGKLIAADVQRLGDIVRSAGLKAE
jgi:tripartite-type tricarboxylate transporter receptor subunit TctC